MLLTASKFEFINRLHDHYSKIKNYRGPLLISHGDADEVVPYAHGPSLYAAANDPKRLITVAGGKHNDPQPEEYRLALDEFIDKLPPLGSPAIKPASVAIE